MAQTGRDPKDIEPDITVGFVLAPKFTLLAFASFVEALRHAADIGDRSRQIYCHWTILGASRTPIPSSCGVAVTPWRTFDEVASELSSFDYVVVVGGLISSLEDVDPDVYEFLRRTRDAGIPLIGLCSGFFVLARAGLLDGKNCCTHWIYEQKLRQEHPLVNPIVGRAYVRDGDIYTALGGVAPMKLAIRLIERHSGRQRALKCVERLCGDQSFVDTPVFQEPSGAYENCGNRFVESAIQVMRLHITNPLSIEETAAIVGVSRRQLSKVFNEHTGQSPAEFFRKMRLEEARWRLLNSSSSITRIALATGFSDSAHFCHAFKKEFGETPKAFREMRIMAAVVHDERQTQEIPMQDMNSLVF